ncbi:DUF6193 family natural product biosynthesis protein [Streptomyces sp. NPDC059499]|uniref:DUF6193 family natural product biosynthesis protein n=1 Tax=Streptomyces sp. NPDC059499 TaxID=3346852 RepID=UPI0036CD64DE
MASGVEGYLVYGAGARYAELLGEVATPQEAVALVVAHLPSDCGAAVEKPWQGADSFWGRSG